MTDWVYQAIVTKVYDGDTITVDLDMGLRVWQKEIDVRLFGINAPELKGATHDKGVLSRDALRALLPLGSKVTVMSHAYEKYGRLLATVVTAPDEDGASIEVNKWMVAHGFAVKYMETLGVQRTMAGPGGKPVPYIDPEGNDLT